MHPILVFGFLLAVLGESSTGQMRPTAPPSNGVKGASKSMSGSTRSSGTTQAAKPESRRLSRDATSNSTPFGTSGWGMQGRTAGGGLLWSWNAEFLTTLEPVVEESPEVEPESSLLRGSGVSIGWKAYRDYRVAPLPGAGGAPRTKLVEVKGQRAREPVAESGPAEVPWATVVPGKPGFVELSFDPRGLPYIDVRGLTPGSEAQIIDPLEFNRIIRFRIPEKMD